MMHRVLVVDDEEITVNAVSNYILSNFGVEVYRAYSGPEAQKILRARRFDVVITDISMPAMSGMELLDFIKHFWPKCRVILLTAYADFAYAHHALQYERVEYLLKADGFDALQKKLHACFQSIQQEHEQEEHAILLKAKYIQMTTYVQNDLLERLLLRNEKPVAQQEFADAELPFHSDDPVFLAVSRVDSAHRLQTGEMLSVCASYMAPLQERGIFCVHHLHNDSMVSFAQLKDGGQSADAIVLLKDAFERSAANLDTLGIRMTTGMDDRFYPFTALADRYIVLQQVLVRFSDVDGVINASALCRQEAEPTKALPLLTMDDLNMLYKMASLGQREECLTYLRQQLAQIRAVADMYAAPLTGLSGALCFFFSSVFPQYVQHARKDIAMLANPHGTGEAYLEKVLTMANEAFAEKQSEQWENQSWLISQIDAYLLEHFQEDITLTMLSEVLHYSVSYLARAYKKQKNVSLMNRLTEIRLNHAKLLLRSTSLKLSDIARQSGFYTAKYFNEVFKKNMGCTPNQWREQVQ